MNPFDLPPRRYSYDEIAAWPDEARRELHDGKPILIYAPGFARTLAYARAIGCLSMWFHEVNSGGNLGETFYSVDWQLDEWNFLGVDLCFFGRERLNREIIKRADNQCLVAPPDLVIHICDSTSAIFAGRRHMKACASRAVPFFWGIDAESRKGSAFRLEGESYVEETAYSSDGVFSCPLFPGSHLKLSAIWDEATP